MSEITDNPTDDCSFWYTEYRHKRGAAFSLKVDSHLFTHKGGIQRIDVFDTYEFGRVLTLDGLVMTTEKDEWMYHEMLVHVPMFSHPGPKRVLIIGGGDGGSLREVLRHSGVEEALLVEIDANVVEAARRFLPGTSSAMDDKRATIIIEEGAAFVRKNPSGFDVIIIDSTDPTKGAGGLLFTEEFYRDCKLALKPGGVMSAESEDVLYGLPWWKMGVGRIKRAFRISRLYWGAMSSYPSGTWTYMFASDSVDPESSFRKRDAAGMSGRLKYYNPDIHDACFRLPNFMATLFEEA
ncbi:MAG: polyamine aminopropyltransferase [Pseudomonadota bacterium]